MCGMTRKSKSEWRARIGGVLDNFDGQYGEAFISAKLGLKNHMGEK